MYILYASITLFIVCLGFNTYQYRAYRNLQTEHALRVQELINTKATLETKSAEAGTLGMTLEKIKQAYSLSEERGTELLTELTSEKERNETFEKQIGKISGTVGKLDKLSKIDPELLMKYSKVYFLNEHYIPEKVEAIASEFSFKVAEQEFINAKVEPYLRELLEDAKADGINILVVSGYRSYNEQKGLKTAYTTQYGSGANTFSADQGYSEHQLGTTVDFTTTEVGGGLTGFEKSEAYTWLQENAYKYGFVLSYPKDNTYYVFEPWHWRFVGEDLADDLNDDGKFFYDLDQREIDKYLISLFD
jgi:D-alanyl-D-alanine carboxypeptidase